MVDKVYRIRQTGIDRLFKHKKELGRIKLEYDCLGFIELFRDGEISRNRNSLMKIGLVDGYYVFSRYEDGTTILLELIDERTIVVSMDYINHPGEKRDYLNRVRERLFLDLESLSTEEYAGHSEVVLVSEIKKVAPKNDHNYNKVMSNTDYFLFVGSSECDYL